MRPLQAAAWGLLVAFVLLDGAVRAQAPAPNGTADNGAAAGQQPAFVPGGGAPGGGAAPGSGSAAAPSAANATLAPQPKARKAPAVQSVGPTSVIQFVRNRVTVDVNGSVCGQQAQHQAGAKAPAPSARAAQLLLRGARQDGKDAAFSGNASANCTQLVFAFTPDAGVRAGAFAAAVAPPGGGPPLQLPARITVVRPITIGVVDRSVELKADGSPSALRVRLSEPSKGTVRVRLQLSDGALQLVDGDRATWPPGQAGERVFKLRVTSAPRAGRISARLVDAEGGAVVPEGGAEAALVVLSPVLSFEPAKGAILRGSSVQPRIVFKLSGSSTFPSSWSYSTYLLNGSRPAPAAMCAAGAPGAPGCAAAWASWDGAGNVSARGTVWVQPGQAAVPAVELPLEWERVPYEAEYMIGVRIKPLVNGRAAPQAADAAAVVYGAPPGHCPPGTALRRGAARRAADGPTYGSTAALQELHLWVDDGLDGGGANASAEGYLFAQNGSSGSSGGNSSSGSVLDLDPPFQPLTDRYMGLLPHTARAAELVISSTRSGDSVAVDASGCDGLTSCDYNVTWAWPARMWRARYALRAQRRPCWLRVHVFTAADPSAAAAGTAAAGGGGGDGGADDNGGGSGDDDGSGIPDALQPQPAAQEEGRAASAAGDAGAAPPAAVEREGVRRVLYRSYTIRFVPLSPPQSLSLRAISFSNGTATLVACGVPSRLGHLFARPRGGGGGRSGATGQPPLPAPLVAAAGLQPQVAYYLNAPAAAAAAASQARRRALPVRAGDHLGAPQPTQAMYTLVDPLTNETVIWSELSQAECASDRFVLAPLGQVLALGGDARMAPELDESAEADGVKVAMSGVALALSGGGGGAAGGGVGGGLGAAGGGGGGLIPAALLLQDAVNASLPSAAPGGGGGRLGAPQLPGASLELPVITTADDGLSSKTYTLVLYSNISSAQALSKLRASGAPANATPPDADGAAAARRGGAAGAGTRTEEEEEAQLRVDAFGSRPKSWPRSPGESANCSLCARGTYSSKLDARECQVCPPGKFSPAPYSAGCSLCPQGSFSYYWGADTCRTCLPGTFAGLKGSLYCDICPDGLTTLGEGASGCDVRVDSLATPEYVMMLSFGVVLSGASLRAVSRDTTGINGSSEGIVAVLVRSDTASALNVSLEAVTIGGVRQVSRRQLLVNVSAAVPINTEDAAAADTRDLSADALIMRLIDDPNAFLRTTQTIGAESAAVTDLTTERRHNALGGGPPSLHAVLWPSLAGAGLLAGSLGFTIRRWRRRRRERARGGALAPIMRAGSIGGGGGGVGAYEDSAGFTSALGGAYPRAPRLSSDTAIIVHDAAPPAAGRRRIGSSSGGGGWWGRLRGALPGRRSGGGGGPRRLEMAYVPGSGGGGGGGGVTGLDLGDDASADAEPHASPREDSFATLLRQKQQQLLADARARRAARAPRGGGGGAGACAAQGGEGGGADANAARGAGVGGMSDSADGRDGTDASSTGERGPPSDLADSATELEHGRAGGGL